MRQLLNVLRATPLTPAEEARVRAVLNDSAFALYQTMPPGDRRHSLRVLDALIAQGHCARPLLQAALLHDVAKRELGVGYRSGVVLLNRVSPTALARAAHPSPASWRYPFYVSLHHPARGAELAAAANVDARAIALIRAHQDAESPFAANSELSAWHHALKQMDDRN